MLDIDFLRSLGIKEELLPTPRPNDDAINEQVSIIDLLLATKFNYLSEEELKKLLFDWSF